MNLFTLSPKETETFYFIGGYIKNIKERTEKNYFNFFIPTNDEVISVRCFNNYGYSSIVRDAFTKGSQVSCVISKDSRFPNGYMLVAAFAVFNTNQVIPSNNSTSPSIKIKSNSEEVYTDADSDDVPY